MDGWEIMSLFRKHMENGVVVAAVTVTVEGGKPHRGILGKLLFSSGE